MAGPVDPPDRAAELLDRLRAGDGAAVGPLFELHRDRLWRMVAVRLDRRAAARVSPDDVLQDAFLDVAKRVGEYLADPAVPVYVWLRFLVAQRLGMVHRMHLGAAGRDAGREVSLDGPAPFAAADSMAGQLAGRLTSPSGAAARHEAEDRVREALAGMDPLDREVLALRHIEELGNAEAAAVLGISKDAASKRHVRALKRLREVLGDES